MTAKIKTIILASFFLVGLSLQVLMFVDPALAQTPPASTLPTASKPIVGVTNSYSGHGVQASIEAVLCTPTNSSFSANEGDPETYSGTVATKVIQEGILLNVLTVSTVLVLPLVAFQLSSL